MTLVLASTLRCIGLPVPASSEACSGVTCELPQLRQTEASDFPTASLSKYQTTYPYSFSETEGQHTAKVWVNCSEGFRARGGMLDQTCSRAFEIVCWDGYFQDPGVNASDGGVVTITARCEPSVCPPFNNASNSNVTNRSALQDANALSWNVTTEVGYAVGVNVSCKPGYRAVDRGYTGQVGCSYPSWYIASCGTCGWELIQECQPVWCEAPAGPSVKLTSPANFGVYGQPNMTVVCSDGYVAATAVMLAP